jgi:hypothetical protein
LGFNNFTNGHETLPLSFRFHNPDSSTSPFCHTRVISVISQQSLLMTKHPRMRSSLSGETDLYRSDEVCRHSISQTKLLQALTPCRFFGSSAENSNFVEDNHGHQTQNICETYTIDLEIHDDNFRYNNISYMLAILENIAIRSNPRKVQSRRFGLNEFINRNKLPGTRAA